MTADELFSLAGMAAMIGWAMLIFLPRRFDVVFWIPQYVIPGVLALGYAALMLVYFFQGEGGYGSIAEVRALFARDEVLLAGWVHYLAFDLFIGAWIARQSDKAGISRLIQTVFLIATFMFGPVGLALFLVTRGLMGRKEVTA